MRVLLDTNIIIHREASTVVRQDIGILFQWLDRLGYQKCIHPITVTEISKHKDPRVVASFKAKLASYVTLKTEAPEAPAVQKLRVEDRNVNSQNDTTVLKELYADRVNLLITEDRGIHTKARMLGIDDRVFTIDSFLEKVTAENPDWTEYRVLSVKRSLFGNLDINDPFFDSFKRDYVGFSKWFNRKADDIAYVCVADDGLIQAFLYLKDEDTDEVFADITPPFQPKRRLKIGTFKVIMNGHKLGERFLKILFDNAVRRKAEEIYLTIFNRDEEQERLVAMLQDWGFAKHGTKTSSSGEEMVMVRDFSPRADRAMPSSTFPYMSAAARKYIVAIYPEYHTELLPDSILRGEQIENFTASRSNRNALKKVYISRSITRSMRAGDIVVFYRTAERGAAYYTSVATTLGIVERVVTNITDEQQFLRHCRKRSVFTDAELLTYWNYSPGNRPFVVKFLYTHSLPKRPNLKLLMEHKVIAVAPRGFDLLSDHAFQTLIELSNADQSLIVH